MSVVPMPSIPHLAIPFRVAPGGGFATVQQGSRDEIAQSVAVLAGTVLGTRPELLSYGVSDLVFLSRSAPEELVTALRFWEPRVVTNADVVIDTVDALITTYNLDVTAP